MVAKTQIKNNGYTTITISRDNKNKIEELKHMYRYNTINEIVSYMVEIFSTKNNEAKTTCQKKKILKK